MIIADAIHAGHVAADQITGTHITGGTINAGHIEVGSRARNYGATFEYDYYYGS